jgi:hypothetical protein
MREQEIRTWNVVRKKRGGDKYLTPRMRAARKSKNEGDLGYEKIKGGPDLESATEKEIAEMNAAAVVEVTKQQPRDQESAQDEEKVDTSPSNLCPGTVIREMVAEN